MSPFVGALDQGTSSTRFIIFDARGTPVASAQKEHRQHCPRPGWVEHDPLEIWRNSLEVCTGALERGGLAAADLAAIGIANQRETTVLWDRRTGAPLHNAIVWQDTRVERLVAAHARAGGADRFRERTGLPLASYFSAPKLQWLLEEVPGARAMAEAGDALFGTIDSWLLWNLTGGAAGGTHLTDVTNASRTQLMSLRTLEWDEELLAAFGVPRPMLPRIVPSSAPHGEAKVAPLAGVHIAGMLGDQQAALAGQGCFEAGEAKSTYGTGCFVLMNTGERLVQSRAGLVTTAAWRPEARHPCYALEGSVAVAGALVQWLRDNLGLIRGSGEIEALAREAPDNGGVYLVPAFSGLYAPHWNARARGLIIGLTGFATRAHIARAALEATAFQTADVIRAMQADCALELRELRVDGGMSVNDLLMQFQADVLDAAVIRPQVIETTALGAACAAGLAAGYWSGLGELRALRTARTRFEPAMERTRRGRLLQSWEKAVSRALDWEG